MVLITVAVLLGLWGIYALVSGNDDDGDANGAGAGSDAGTSAPQTPPPAGGQQGQDGQQPPVNPEDRPGGQPGQPGQQDQQGQPGHDGHDGQGGQPGAQPGGQPGQGGAPQGPVKVNVLNNSTTPNLAADVSGLLDAEGNDIGEVGNLPGNQFTVPQTTVFFQPGNAAAEQRARELADRVGGVAREYDQGLPENTRGHNDVTVVLSGPVPN